MSAYLDSHIAFLALSAYLKLANQCYSSQLRAHDLGCSSSKAAPRWFAHHIGRRTISFRKIFR